jgi:hypothetical protein
VALADVRGDDQGGARGRTMNTATASKTTQGKRRSRAKHRKGAINWKQLRADIGTIAEHKPEALLEFSREVEEALAKKHTGQWMQMLRETVAGLRGFVAMHANSGEVADIWSALRGKMTDGEVTKDVLLGAIGDLHAFLDGSCSTGSRSSDIERLESSLEVLNESALAHVEQRLAQRPPRAVRP